MKDSQRRSLIKGISWRVIGTIDTFILATFILHKHGMDKPFLIAATEVTTKIVLYYFHERGWNFIPWGRRKSGPSHGRSVVKGLSWRALGTFDTTMLAYLYTGDITGGLKLGATELFTKIGLYYLHERIWARIKWGRIPSDDIQDEPSEGKIKEHHVA